MLLISNGCSTTPVTNPKIRTKPGRLANSLKSMKKILVVLIETALLREIINLINHKHKHVLSNSWVLKSLHTRTTHNSIEKESDNTY